LCFPSCARRIKVDQESLDVAWPAVLEQRAMDLLDTLLNFADAISAAVALVGFWYTWVLPPAPDTRALPKGADPPDELERFLRAAASSTRSGQEIT
jgi:hypothetical protein